MGSIPEGGGMCGTRRYWPRGWVGKGGRAELGVLKLSRVSGPHWGLINRQLSSVHPRPIRGAQAVRRHWFLSIQ